MRPEYEELKASLTGHGYGDLPLDAKVAVRGAVQQMIMGAEIKQNAAHALQSRLKQLDDELQGQEELILQVCRAPSGQWVGKLLVGTQEIGGCAACESSQVVVDGVMPDRVELLDEE